MVYQIKCRTKPFDTNWVVDILWWFKGILLFIFVVLAAAIPSILMKWGNPNTFAPTHPVFITFVDLSPLAFVLLLIPYLVVRTAYIDLGGWK